MPTITLPDGSQRTFDHPVSLMEVAADIGPGLAKAAVAGKIDGKLVDLSRTVEDDADIAIVTAKDQEGVEIIRHSTAHLMAQAVKQLYPEAQVTIGPVIDQGFYYDFAFDRPFNDEDLEKIETRMRELASEGDELERRVIERDDAVRFFKDLGEDYKVEIIKDIPGEEQLTLYTQGDFTDLCRGPHVPHTNKLKAFKLLKVAGAYWRGDSDNEMLTRVYGTAFASDKELKRYLKQREEAEKRDHRRLGKQLDLFHFQDEAPGLVFWHPRGWAIWQVIESYMRDVYKRSGYAEIKCPQILDVSLWKKSGHWDNYQENMFFTESEKRTYAVKPMNCPGHVQVFNHGLHSYRDLPIRYGEFGSCHRNEPSGALHGILRVRGFTQDDGHIFCTEKQIEPEVRAFHGQALEVYDTFGFSDVQVKIATRPDKRMGADEVWDEAEEALRSALRAANVEWEELPGEGAFYGPKIEYHLSDAIGRTWQLGTIQVDFMMPERLGATYVDEHSERKHPVMLHRAIVGSMERFIGILIEHHAGQMPTWLAPVQAVTMGITDKHAEYVDAVAERLKAAGLRAQADLRNEKVGFKIREHTLERVPYLLVAGDREIDADSVSVRTRSGEDLGSIKVDELIDRLKGEVAEHK
ncbi:threonine--tRNA ligase [Guyparkeria hydrothermalis]|uniref:threonine--tRNA ligase n=1 Tax=Guyparkeria hydrothermalis TaxID=923 RepID=UPI00202180A6|nr:threonine--tRNA ligase [Guyparkeria hydrothermalis]MCL7751453.1 threonine--tRNA ligase [Guyparkeria hydrothermalis]